MRVLVVTGSRKATYKEVVPILDQLHTEEKTGLVLHGGAPGADRAAGYWCYKNKVQYGLFEAMWDTFGPKAGPMRNEAMMQTAASIYNDDGKVLVAAFPGPDSSGTKDAMRRAKQYGLKVRVTKVAK